MGPSISDKPLSARYQPNWNGPEEVDVEKLVRDKIPELVRASGGVHRFRVAGSAERLNLLLAKLREEAQELTDDPGLSELVDVIEVVDALKFQLGVSDSRLEVERSNKIRERGAFKNGIVLCT